MDPQITTTAAERLGGNFAPTSEPELRLTLSQVSQLLREATAYEKAQRPIVLHTQHSVDSAERSAPQAAAHGGIDVRYPTPPVAPVATAAAPYAPKERSVWPLAFTVSLVGVVTSAAAAAATGSPYAVLAVFAFVSAWGATTYHLVFERA